MRQQYPAARAQYEEVLKLDTKHVVALNDMAWTCQRLHDAGAQGYAERAHQLAPASPAIMDTLAWIYADGGQPARALPLLQKASTLAPDSAEIRFHLGTVLANSGDKRGARRELERLLAAPPGSARRADAQALLATL